ncbi:hypothetical protein [Janibacter indicus]|uniref:hypothetical protein n=1 Tax=Janibacter indicus TaxID=857417 RepID=UPI003EB70CFF
MTLTHGADAARLRQIAAQLRGQAKLTSRIGAEGGARTSVISAVWEGPDRDDFVRDWRVAERSLDDCAAMLTTMADRMTEQAEQQLDASNEMGGPAPAAPPTPSPEQPTDPRPPGMPGPTGPPEGVDVDQLPYYTRSPEGSTFDDEVRGTEGKPVDKDLWDLAFYAQGTEHPLWGIPVVGYTQPPLPEGYEIADPEALGLDPNKFGPNSNPQAYLFQTPDGGLVVAFQGSVEGQDWVTNGRQAFGHDDPQYQRAMELAVEVNEASGGNVTFTGHSLGGGFAAAAAMATGQPAVTFDASGVHDNTAAAAAEMRGDGSTAASVQAEASQGQMRAYRMETDGLTNVQEATGLPDAPGTPITLETPPSLGRDITVGATGAGGALVGGAVGGVTGLFDGNPFDVGDDIAEGAQAGARTGVAVGEGVWGHSWSPMDDAMEERYPD